jgi:predicted DNA-binding protein YlxM (UPF0122 family)
MKLVSDMIKDLVEVLKKHENKLELLLKRQGVIE